MRQAWLSDAWQVDDSCEQIDFWVEQPAGFCHVACECVVVLALDKAVEVQEAQEPVT
jgi:hypothetical protein